MLAWESAPWSWGLAGLPLPTLMVRWGDGLAWSARPSAVGRDRLAAIPGPPGTPTSLTGSTRLPQSPYPPRLAAGLAPASPAMAGVAGLLPCCSTTPLRTNTTAPDSPVWLLCPGPGAAWFLMNLKDSTGISCEQRPAHPLAAEHIAAELWWLPLGLSDPGFTGGPRWRYGLCHARASDAGAKPCPAA